MKTQSTTSPIRYLSVDGTKPREIEGEIVEEGLACISVNGEELATFMCTPSNLDILALGFLFNERIAFTSIFLLGHFFIFILSPFGFCSTYKAV